MNWTSVLCLAVSRPATRLASSTTCSAVRPSSRTGDRSNNIFPLCNQIQLHNSIRIQLFNKYLLYCQIGGCQVESKLIYTPIKTYFFCYNCYCIVPYILKWQSRDRNRAGDVAKIRKKVEPEPAFLEAKDWWNLLVWGDFGLNVGSSCAIDAYRQLLFVLFKSNNTITVDIHWYIIIFKPGIEILFTYKIITC